MIEEITLIRKLTKRGENLIQLAEEATELGEVCLKIIDSNVDTFNITNADFYEELADVRLCIDLIDDYVIDTFEVHAPNKDILKHIVKLCFRLSKAAIKCRRATTEGASPTPVTAEEAEQNLFKAIVSLKSFIDVLGYDYWNSATVDHIYKEKAVRYLGRVLD